MLSLHSSLVNVELCKGHGLINAPMCAKWALHVNKANENYNLGLYVNF